MGRVSGFARQVDIWQSNLQGEARRQLMVATALAARDRALAQNAAALGYAPKFETIVDGARGRSEEQVRPGGTILYLFQVGGALLEQAADATIAALLALSPVLTGRYRDAHRFMVNGDERSVPEGGEPIGLAETDVVSFVNLLPYARRIEKGWSGQAPNGVYEAAAAIVRSRFGGVVNIRFSYDRYPGFGVGQARRGGRPSRHADVRRSELFPTITLSLKSAAL